MTETKSILSDQVICTEFEGGEGVLVDLKTKRYFELNETALLIWKRLEQGGTVDDIVTEVVTGYEVAPSHARLSIDNLIDRLRSYKLVSDPQSGTGVISEPNAIAI